MFIDSHCHLPHKKYDKSVEDIIQEAQTEGVTKIINIGTSIKENQEALEISTKYKNVYTSIGIYPHEDKNADLESLREHLKSTAQNNKKVIAIGECGMDITDWDGGRTIPQQIELFEMQCDLAVELNLPLIIHNRNGDKYVLEVLKKYTQKGLTGVSHCFVQDWDYAKTLLDQNFRISFTGIITYPSGKQILETVEKVPDDRFLIETDAPYLAPQQYRGQINYPKYVKIVAEKVAQVKKLDLETVARLSYSNTCELFNIQI